VPAVCLIEAARVVGPELVAPLLESKAALVIDLDGGSWRVLAANLEVLGTLGAASALDACERFGCDILTGSPELYANLGDDPPIIPIG